MVNKKGIEANPNRILAIIEMTSLKTLKDVQRQAGRLATLNKFISKVKKRNLPFFKNLKGAKKFKWSQKCESLCRAKKVPNQATTTLQT